ncbi:hypothetical protein FKM82_001153 [Ascaphus truei]
MTAPPTRVPSCPQISRPSSACDVTTHEHQALAHAGHTHCLNMFHRGQLLPRWEGLWRCCLRNVLSSMLCIFFWCKHTMAEHDLSSQTSAAGFVSGEQPSQPLAENPLPTGFHRWDLHRPIATRSSKPGSGMKEFMTGQC